MRVAHRQTRKAHQKQLSSDPRVHPKGRRNLNARHTKLRIACAGACVAGYGRSDAHSSVSHPEGEFPVIALDYCQSDDRASPIPVVKDTYHKWPGSDIVPSKGVQHPYSVAAFVDILVNHGRSKYILKSNNEPAILELKRVAAAGRRLNHGHTIIFEEGPVAEHQANGFIEWVHRRMRSFHQSEEPNFEIRLRRVSRHEDLQ